jgi:hypothetical protein
MRNTLKSLCACVVIVLLCSFVAAQSANSTASPVVPQLVKFSGKAVDEQGQVMSGTAGLTFSIYSAEQGGAPLWTETQNITTDTKGNYTVLLGSTNANGLPLELFSSGEARWVGVRVNGGEEQPRVLLLSVPYALKAADAQTLGGLPASAFVLAAPPNGSSVGNAPPAPPSSNNNPPTLSGSGKANYIPIWTSGSKLGNSVLFQSGKGNTAQVGIGTATPASTLDVNGTGTIRGLFSLPATGTATSSGGFNSQPQDWATSVFNSSTQTAVAQTFQWQAEPVNNNTSNATGSLNLLFAQGSGKPAETGLNIASNGQINFASGQTFPGAGSITGVTAGSDLTGGGNSGNVTLNLDTTKVPLLGAANTFTANQTVNGTMTATTFAGSGSALANVNAALLSGFTAGSFSQIATTNFYQSSPLGTVIPQVLAPVNNATTASGSSSNPLDLTSSSYNSGAGAAQNETFRWQGEATGNNTASPSGTLNLLFGANGAAPTETGLNIGSNGQITFASGQTFPGTANGTVTSVGSGAGLTGGPITTSGSLSIASGGVTNAMLQNSSLTVAAGTDLTGGGAVSLGGSTTLNVDTTKVPQLGTANTFTGNQTVNGNLSATGSLSSGPITASATIYPAVTANDTSSTGAGGVLANSTNGTAVGASSTNGNAVTGTSTNATGVSGAGITGLSGTGVVGVYGSGGNYGVQGVVNNGVGVWGVAGNGNGNVGVSGTGEVGVWGTGTSYGVYATANSYGVFGTGSTYGVLGESGSSSGSGGGFSNSTTGDALFTYNQSGGYAAFFDGNVDVDGKLSKAGGSFKIDHPLDPANKYLYHSFVESPDMKNIYDGVATLNANGEAMVEMPDWFGVLNRDFRYQLTCIGGFAPVYIAEELANNQFKIGGGRAGMRVSWQITGIRQDAWANANRIPVEEEKEAKLKGFYLHPQLYGAPAEKGIEWARHPEMMKKLLQDQEQMKEKQAALTGSETIATPARPIPPPITEKPAPRIPPTPLPNHVTKRAEGK